ncbi:hypothetical protein Tcan_03410 [Toxocara canis]|nr:hypothetical protein Tcan_03410 [Toxocara canis]
MGNSSQSALRTGPRSAENLAHNQHQQQQQPQSTAEMKMLMVAAGAESRCDCGPAPKRFDSKTSGSLYGAMNSSSASSTKAHFCGSGGGSLYQGETFVLNDRNYLI